MESIQSIMDELEKIENIDIKKNPFAAVPTPALKKALNVLEEFAQENFIPDDLT